MGFLCGKCDILSVVVGLIVNTETCWLVIVFDFAAFSVDCVVLRNVVQLLTGDLVTVLNWWKKEEKEEKNKKFISGLL